MLNALCTVFVREARDLLRDRRALFWLFATPILLPLLYAVAGTFIVWQVVRQTREGLPVAVVGGEQLPGLVAKLEDSRALQLGDAPLNVEEALQAGELLAVLEIPPDAAALLESERPLTLTLTSSRSGWLADIAAVSIQGILSEYNDEVLAERLSRRELDPSWIEPIRVERVSAMPTGIAVVPTVAGRPVSSLLGSFFLPLTIASWAASGGLGMIADMIVGEKERRTMESLLVTPASWLGIVLGKIALSVLVSTIVIAMWWLDSLAYMYVLAALPSEEGDAAVPLFAGLGNLGLGVVWAVLLMLPLIVATNGLVAAACALAKNQREANLFLGVLQLLLPGLAVLAAFGVGTASPGVYALPAVGVLVAVRDLLGGGIVPGMLALAWAAATAYAVGAVLLAAYVFSRQRALIRGV